MHSFYFLSHKGGKWNAHHSILFHPFLESRVKLKIHQFKSWRARGNQNTQFWKPVLIYQVSTINLSGFFHWGFSNGRTEVQSLAMARPCHPQSQQPAAQHIFWYKVSFEPPDTPTSYFRTNFCKAFTWTLCSSTPTFPEHSKTKYNLQGYCFYKNVPSSFQLPFVFHIR